MKTHPVVPSAKLFKIELTQDQTEFETLLAREREIDEKIADQSRNGAKLLADFEKCEDEKIDVSKCPAWKSWGEWTKCGKCGVQSIKRVRSGCISGLRQIEQCNIS